MQRIKCFKIFDYKYFIVPIHIKKKNFKKNSITNNYYEKIH